MFDLDLIRRSAVTSHGGRASVPAVTTRQRLMSAALSEALAGGSAFGGEDLHDGDGNPTYVFGYTVMLAPYIVR